MLARLMSLLENRLEDSREADPDRPFDRRRVAAAALMVEASWIDRDFDGVERAAILALIRDRFDLTGADAEALLAVAEDRQDASYSDWMFTQAIRTGFDAQDQAEIVGMLWEVAYADGTLHRFENEMIRRIAREIGLAEDVVNAVRRAAIERQGRTGPDADSDAGSGRTP